jgi:predicted nuclease of predicted toxin-antitoxin system
MRLLADENFPKALVEWLRALGHDTEWARTDYAGWNDVRLLELAEEQERIVLTLDKDFWQIALQRRKPLRRGGVIHFRAHPATVEKLMPLMAAFTRSHMDWAGYVTRISRDGIQIFRAG